MPPRKPSTFYGRRPTYEPVPVEFLGCQKTDLNEAASYRNNLVAASRYHNFLFIAIGSDVHVYVPIYPDQTLPLEPHTKLVSEVDGDLEGYIDQVCPHNINSLTIGDLGTEEVLVSAHDDGDVCVWYTSDLTRMAMRFNVGKSAWGVSIHRKRRLLAVSANTHLITVFDLAINKEVLAAEEKEDGNMHIEKGGQYMEKNWLGIVEDNSIRRRRPNCGKDVIKKQVAEESQAGLIGETRESKNRENPTVKDNVIKILKGHNDNIPSISFLNDNSGRWLVGTSIDGMVILWDVYTERMVEKRLMGSRTMGWSVLSLNPCSFLSTNSFREALGPSSVPSNTSRKSQKSSGSHRNGDSDEIPPRVHVFGIRPIPTDYYDQPQANPSQSSEALVWDITPPAYSVPGEGPLYEYVIGDHSDSEHDEPFLSEVGNEEAESVDEVPISSHFANTSTSPSSEQQHHTEDDKSAEDFEVGSAEDSAEEPPQPPKSFIFVTTVNDAYLLPTKLLSPVVMCQKFLMQPFTYTHDFLSYFDRLNMVQAIPELSLVIAASQMGRVGLFRLTRFKEKFMMRLDAILPREKGKTSASERTARPTTVLVGMAVCPVQGRELGQSRSGSEDSSAESKPYRRRHSRWRGVEKMRRWRLFLVYKDGTLTYELGRDMIDEINWKPVGFR